MDFQAHGTNLLWRLITENSEIKCVQHSPLFPADPEKNPILCSLAKQKLNFIELALTALQVIRALILEHKTQVIALAATILSAIITYLALKKSKNPPVLRGWPIVGEALSFQKSPLKLLTEGFHKYGNSPSKCFGIQFASLTHFMITNAYDLELVKEDNQYEVRFSLHTFLEAINFPIITRKENFDSDLHTNLIRTHLSNPATVAAFGPMIVEASKEFLKRNPLVPEGQSKFNFASLNDWCNQYITFVASRCIVSPEGYNNEELLSVFIKFNDNAINAI